MSSARAVRAGGARPTGLTGTAGEYLVAAELSLLGWLATVTIKNAPRFDILAQIPERGFAIAIQTKTASQGNHFQLGKACEQPPKGTNEWYVFVQIQGEKQRARFYVIPTLVVSGGVYAQHRQWLAETGRGGKPHKDNPMRTILPARVAGYEDRWDLLQAPADTAPLLIDPVYTEFVDKWGLPQGHPGWPSPPSP